MISVDRGRAGIDGNPIRPRGTWSARAAVQTQVAISDGPGHQVTGLYRDPAVKAALEALFHFKCAYCETGGFAGFPWDVEHFRPKNRIADDRSHPGYYWLAYTWENLYTSCVFCNQRRKDQPTYADPQLGAASGKLDEFPIEDETRRARTPTDALAHEAPLLLDPCRDQPELHLRFDATGSVSARDGSARGSRTIDVFGLNRKRLVRERLEVLQAIAELIEELVAGGATPAKATRSVLATLSRPKYRHSALVEAVRTDPALFGF